MFWLSRPKTPPHCLTRRRNGTLINSSIVITSQEEGSISSKENRVTFAALRYKGGTLYEESRLVLLWWQVLVPCPGSRKKLLLGKLSMCSWSDCQSLEGPPASVFQAVWCLTVHPSSTLWEFSCSSLGLCYPDHFCSEHWVSFTYLSEAES